MPSSEENGAELSGSDKVDISRGTVSGIYQKSGPGTEGKIYR